MTPQEEARYRERLDRMVGQLLAGRMDVTNAVIADAVRTAKRALKAIDQGAARTGTKRSTRTVAE